VSGKAKRRDTAEAGLRYAVLGVLRLRLNGGQVLRAGELPRGLRLVSAGQLLHQGGPAEDHARVGGGQQPGGFRSV
jgi:hypothetical protein